MPYQGGKERLQKAMRVLSIVVSILIFSVGLFFQIRLFEQNRYNRLLYKKLKKDYCAVMLTRECPASGTAVKELSGLLRRIRDVKSGQLSITGQASASAKLTLVLEAFNKCASRVNLNIDSISVGAKSISISGDTSSRGNTLKLFEEIKQTNLDILQQRLDTKGGRDSFNISVRPKGVTE
jgi:hypothetical protein